MVLASDQSSDVRRTMAVALRLCLLASSDDSLLTSLAEREHSVFTDLPFSGHYSGSSSTTFRESIRRIVRVIWLHLAAMTRIPSLTLNGVRHHRPLIVLSLITYHC